MLPKARWLEFYARHFPTFELKAALAEKLKTVYIHFNNDAEAFAIRNAVTISNFFNAGKKGDKIDREAL